MADSKESDRPGEWFDLLAVHGEGGPERASARALVSKVELPETLWSDVYEDPEPGEKTQELTVAAAFRVELPAIHLLEDEVVSSGVCRGALFGPDIELLYDLADLVERSYDRSFDRLFRERFEPRRPQPIRRVYFWSARSGSFVATVLVAIGGIGTVAYKVLKDYPDLRKGFLLMRDDLNSARSEIDDIEGRFRYRRLMRPAPRRRTLITPRMIRRGRRHSWELPRPKRISRRDFEVR